MGNGTSRITAPGFRWRTSAQAGVSRKPVRLGIDVPLLLAVTTLLVFGLLMVYSASSDYSLMVLGKTPTFMFSRQLIFAGLGIGLAAFLAMFNYHRYQKFALALMAFTVGLLIIVLVVNEVINNASRTLLGGSVQPSELAKIAIVIYLSVWLYAKRDQLSEVGFGLFPLGVILGTLGGLIILQPDISATATIFILGGLMFFLAGGDLRQIALLILIGLVAGWLVYQLSPTGNQRVSEYSLSFEALTRAPMHLSRSLEALVKGGWFGVGIGRADTKLTGLPVPPTDSIFAVVGEETGFAGAITLVTLYILILWRGLRIAQRAPDGLGKLLAAGLSLWIVIEALINMAVIVGLVPFAGNALPFISAGGSSLVVSLAAVGILLNISRLSNQSREEEERTFDAVVNLRWRDRGRRVSRPRRSESANRR
ncbi:MAG TPA: putative peptidoglycan glycosyltransferase FtsW [Anaerolineales bacterium]|nr:putative peptidoglycan glycosyltransferase FtsW [Anaerolineales bacterium]